MDELSTQVEKAVEYARLDSLIDDTEVIIESAKDVSRRAINAVLIRLNWLLGKCIYEKAQGQG